MHFGRALAAEAGYVEKKTCKFEVQAARIAASPGVIGTGLAKIGFIFERRKSNLSIFRCSCRRGKLVSLII
jgi:hypothetical protein